jgi:leucyl aminopeptidase
MSVARRLPAALAVLALAFALPAQAREEESWITIERANAQRALAAFGAAGHPGALTIVDAARSESMRVGTRPTDVVVARINESDVAELSAILHRELHRCGGFIWHATREEAEREAARANDPHPQPAAAPPIPYTIDNGPVVQALMAPIAEANIRNTITTLGAFFTRYHNCQSGANSANWIRDQWLALTANIPGRTVDLFPHTSYTTLQPSVILTIPGTTLASEVVILGAHQDSIAGSNCSTSRAPGEDDDASGIATITEVIRVVGALGYKPQRTVKFMAYAAEEVGLRGSKEIAALYRAQGVNVVGAVQFDMTNYKGSTGDIYIYTDFTNSVQNTFIGSLVDTYLPTLVRGTDLCGYACSDHASWTNQAYPASLPFEARFTQYDPFIHTQNDTLANCGGTANHALKFSKLAAAYMAEVAKGGFVPNQVPVANAGPDIVAGPLLTTLDGSASFDPDGQPSSLTYAWTQVSGPPVVILNANSAIAKFRASEMRRGDYVFRLTVNDGAASASDDVLVRARQTEP